MQLSLVFALPARSGSISGVRRIGDARFEQPLRIGEPVQVEVVVDRRGADPSVVVARADVLCHEPESPCDDLLPHFVADDRRADELECVDNIPV